MPNVVAFMPRPRPSEPAAPAPLAGLALRAHLEQAAQTALDAADKIIAALDRIKDDAETATEPVFKAIVAHAGQVIHLHEPAQPMPAPEPAPEAPQDETQDEPAPVATADVRQLFPPLPWGGAGNVVAAAGCAVLALVGMRA
ncbi:hypothetical protein [Methylobacterium sp. J-067]|uniref:hypothetical protein n=1 Tax=Methylobacterium sp. J-067 TaxID=2836648 RepID=UPI001FB8FE73|nr:hypothetical protein [Methylobacterium sp. J-067]MCJ2023854.1 hypothetical protein [Methylobacterium sp. J-067]